MKHNLICSGRGGGDFGLANRDRNLAGALAYLFWFVTGIVILLVEKHDRFIRFHAWQAIFLSLVFFGLNLIGVNLAKLPFIGILAGLYNGLLFIAALIVWVVSMWQAYLGKVFRWPLVGRWAERQAR